MIGTFDQILFEGLPYCFIALGMVLTFRYLRLIDVTFAASFVLCPSIAATSLVAGWPFALAAAAGCAASLVLAALTLLVTNLLRIEHLLASLITSFAGFALALLFTEGTLSLHQLATPLAALRELDRQFWADGLPLHPSQNAFFAATLIGTKALLDRFLDSEAGLAFRAMEDEKSVAHVLSPLGLKTTTQTAIGVLTGNLLASLSGLLVMLKEDQVTAHWGFDALVLGIAAYLFGVALLERRAPAGGKNRLASCMQELQRFRPSTAAIGGMLIYFAILASVSRLDVPSSAPKLLFVALLIAVLTANRLPDIRGAREARSQNFTVASSTQDALTVDGACVAYDAYPAPRQILSQVSVRAEPGKLVHLIGPNGVGKTTLLRYIAGLVPGTGKVSVPANGHAANKALRVTLVGYIAQNAAHSTSATLSATEFLQLNRLGGCTSLRRWDALALHCVEAQSLPIGALSGGQRQYLSLIALLERKNSPRVVLLDEPLTHLDEEHASLCVDIIDELLREQRVVLIVQHDLMPSEAMFASAARQRLAKMIAVRLPLPAAMEHAV